jgi:hypothetical protein
MRLGAQGRDTGIYGPRAFNILRGTLATGLEKRCAVAQTHCGAARVDGQISNAPTLHHCLPGYLKYMCMATDSPVESKWKHALGRRDDSVEIELTAPHSKLSISLPPAHHLHR